MYANKTKKDISQVFLVFISSKITQPNTSKVHFFKRFQQTTALQIVTYTRKCYLTFLNVFLLT
jgi:hypothetical protein